MPLNLRPWVAAIAAAGVLSGCLGGQPPASKQAFGPADGQALAGGQALADGQDPANGQTASAKPDKGGAVSPLIADLQSRQSLLPPDGPFATVAASVVKASAGASVAELRVAQLKAQAKSKNWLPQIGPSVNLTSLVLS